MDISDLRATELTKYQQAYQCDGYAMGPARKQDARTVLQATRSRGSYLDVGCGRAEMLDIATELGFDQVYGTEVVADLIHPDPRVFFSLSIDICFDDQSVDTVTCFDVLEHLLPADTIGTLVELNRIARKAIILTVNNQPSICNGFDLHINKRDYADWDKLIRQHIDGYIQWLPKPANQISECWLVTKFTNTV